jgi:hypothetical protein
MAMNLLRSAKPGKSLKVRRKVAGWDQEYLQAILLVRPVIDFMVDLRIDSSAMTEMSRDRETSCRKEVCREAQR